METIVTIIAQVGFPIVCCLLLWKALVDEKDAHKAEMQAITEALNNNTKALIHLTDLLDLPKSALGGKHENDP